MLITYGIPSANIDITDLLYKNMRSVIVYIPPDDNLRAKLFTDPIFGTVKSIFINGNSYSANTPIFIDTVTESVYTESMPDYIREVYPEECLLAKVYSLQKKLVLRHGSMREEFPEQKMAVRYLKGTEKVLEIGGNVGRNSLIIASLVPQETFVTLESDPNIAKQLEENRDANSMRFHIESSALSMRPLIQRGWDTIVSDKVLDGYKKVNTITLDELREKYKIDFDTLVLDCEGAFYYILHDMPSILDGITTVIMENDYYNMGHKLFIDESLKLRGFQCVYSETLGSEFAYKNFPCEKEFFQVWQLQKN